MKKLLTLIPAICLTAWLGCGGGGTESFEQPSDGGNGDTNSSEQTNPEQGNTSKPVKDKGVIAVSYTHLRAHET